MTDHTPPLVTTVIPTYRRPKLLARAIDSALGQIDNGVVVRVCDNASGDDTAAVVAAAVASGGNVDYRCHPANIGASANFVSGVQGIRTPFFSILSDDDYLLPGFYRRALAGLAEHPEAMFWAGTTINVGPDGRVWDARMDRWSRDGVYLPPEGLLAMTGGSAPNWIGILFRARVLEEFGFVDIETRGPADLDYTLRLAARYPFVVERMPVAAFLLNPQSFSATEPLSSFWPGWQRMLHNMRHLDGIAAADQHRVVAALNADAERMLFRRGLNALANGRVDFAADAAAALSQHGAAPGRQMALGAAVRACRIFPSTQAVLRLAYGSMERRLVRSRGTLQEKYGHLLRQA